MSVEDDTSSTIDGWPVTGQVLKSRRSKSCEMCGFDNWAPGDTKYVVEYDYAREHLCPTCAVSRGLSGAMFYRQNQNAQRRGAIDSASGTPAKCSAVGETNEKREAPAISDMTAHKKSKAVHTEDQITSELVAEKLFQAKWIGCSLSPHRECALFVAWNGVIVLVYEGFPLSLLHVKQSIQESFPDLKSENFGSKWPKTTLGALKDNAEDFTLEDLQTFRNICGKFSVAIASLKLDIPVRSISVVEYEYRSLERLRSRKDVALESVTLSNPSPVSLDEMANVDEVVGEWRDPSTYLSKVNAPGSRVGSYRSAYGGGATCVAFLDPLPGALQHQLKEFRSAIEIKFPGRYAWMEEKSLHCTLRSLDRSRAGTK